MANADQHLILDVSAIVDIWLSPRPEENPLAALLESAPGCKAQLWIAATQLPTLEYVTSRRLKSLGVAPETALETTRNLIRQLLTRVNVLSNFGYEQQGLYEEAKDFEDGQIAASARCLQGGAVVIVTEDRAFDTLGEMERWSPQDAVDALERSGTDDSAAIPFIDLAAQQRLIRPDIERRIETVLRHGKYILGPEVVELEGRLADYVGVKHCIGVASGTDALLIALMAVGVGRDDEVITTPFSFISTAETIVLLGARPVFVDIDPRTYNLDPGLIQAAMTPRTRAIMPVSLYGQCADMDAINAVAAAHGLPVIEDGAQSFGATYKDQRSCALSTIGCTSFFPSKPLGCYGDGGACFTDDDDLAKAMREIRVHGQDRRYHHPRIGINGRLDTLQAAVLLAKMAVFADEVAARARIGARYSELLRDADCVTPHIENHNTSVYAQYTLQVDQRERFIAHLQEQGIPTAVHYPIPLHEQPALAGNSRVSGELTQADRTARRVVSLPMHPYLADDEVAAVAAGVKGRLGT